MIVKVNNNKSREIEIATAQRIVVDAIIVGEKGIGTFTHDKMVDGLDYTRVIMLVRYYTEGSVDCIERGHSDNQVIFKIHSCSKYSATTIRVECDDEYGSLLEEDFLDGYYDFKFQDSELVKTNEY